MSCRERQRRSLGHEENGVLCFLEKSFVTGNDLQACFVREHLDSGVCHVLIGWRGEAGKRGEQRRLWNLQHICNLRQQGGTSLFRGRGIRQVKGNDHIVVNSLRAVRPFNGSNPSLKGIFVRVPIDVMPWCDEPPPDGCKRRYRRA